MPVRAAATRARGGCASSTTPRCPTTSPVAASYNEARLTPSALNGQLVITSRIEVKPTTRLESYIDYWGTVVHAFDVQTSHSELSVTVDARWSTPSRGAAWAPTSSGPRWPTPTVIDRWCEYLGPSGPVTIGPDLADAVAEVRAAPNPAAAVQVALGHRHRAAHATSRAATDVSSTDTEAWALPRGRVPGLQPPRHRAAPRARASPPATRRGTCTRARATSARPWSARATRWIEAWLGGWKAYDPTNRRPVGERHVLVGLGRDYTDVPPLKGIFSGGPTSHQDVTVELTRLTR